VSDDRQLVYRALGMYEGDGDVLVWSHGDALLLEVPGSSLTRLATGDVLEVTTREIGEGTETELALIRPAPTGDVARTVLVSGGTGLTVGGLYGPSLAAGLRRCATGVVAFEVRLVAHASSRTQ
jgi:hypothetical protein